MEIKNIGYKRLMVLITLVSSLGSNTLFAEMPEKHETNKTKAPTVTIAALALVEDYTETPITKGDCPFCGVNKDLFQLRCGHSTCEACLQGTVEYNISQNKLPACAAYPPPSYQPCDVPLDDALVKKLITNPDNLRIYEKIKQA